MLPKPPEGWAQSTDPFLLTLQRDRSLDYAALRSAPVGMTAIFAKC
jgi:hypothetical protein